MSAARKQMPLVYLYPLSWAQTWGVALALIVATVGVVLVAAWLLSKR